MKITSIAIPDVALIEPQVFCSERGFFLESFNQTETMAATGWRVLFAQVEVFA